MKLRVAWNGREARIGRRRVVIVDAGRGFRVELDGLVLREAPSLSTGRGVPRVFSREVAAREAAEEALYDAVRADHLLGQLGGTTSRRDKKEGWTA